MEAVVEPGNDGLVHHMLLYMCSKNFNDTHRDHSNKCEHPNMPRDVSNCRVAIMYAWAIGAGVRNVNTTPIRLANQNQDA